MIQGVKNLATHEVTKVVAVPNLLSPSPLEATGGPAPTAKTAPPSGPRRELLA